MRQRAGRADVGQSLQVMLAVMPVVAGGGAVCRGVGWGGGGGAWAVEEGRSGSSKKRWSHSAAVMSQGMTQLQGRPASRSAKAPRAGAAPGGAGRRAGPGGGRAGVGGRGRGWGGTGGGGACSAALSV